MNLMTGKSPESRQLTQHGCRQEEPSKEFGSFLSQCDYVREGMHSGGSVGRSKEVAHSFTVI
jgi:hypothetical protein